MRAAYIFLLAVSLSLAGCSSIDAIERNNWVEQNRPNAEAGRMKWSDFYSKLRQMTEDADEANSKEIIAAINIIHKAALAHENGKLSASEFASLQSTADKQIADLEFKAAPQEGASEAAWGRGTRTQEKK